MKKRIFLTFVATIIVAALGTTTHAISIEDCSKKCFHGFNACLKPCNTSPIKGNLQMLSCIDTCVNNLKNCETNCGKD